MNPILFDLGFVKIYWYSVMILAGCLIGYVIIMAEAKKFGINKNFMFNLFFYVFIFAIIGARLYYVAFNWSYYGNHLSEILQIWEGGLAIHGGMLAGALVTLSYTKKYKLPVWRIIDIIVVGLIIGQAIGRWGNFFNGEAHGAATTLAQLQSLLIPNFIIEGMNINGIYYHPTFLYESLWCVIGFIILLVFRRLRYTKVGQTTALYFIWYGIGRFIIESMRTDSLMLFDFKMAQIVSIIMVIGGIVLFIIKGRGSKLENQYNDGSDVHDIRF